MENSSAKIYGERVVMNREQYDRMKKTYDAYERKKEQSRINARERYYKLKLEKQRNDLIEKDLTDEEVQFILEHTN